MMTHRLHIFFIIMMALGSWLTAQATYLFHQQKSAYTIVVSPEASVSEKTAAHEMHDWLKAISGADIPVTNDLKAKGHKIFIGFNSEVARLTGTNKPEQTDEAFTYRTVGKNLIIYGGSQRGTMYGVYAFLENELGMRWYTPQCTKVPKLKKWKLKDMAHSEQPAIRYRYSNYYCVDNAPEWSAHNKENMKRSASENNYGNIEAYWSAHTMGQLVPATEFYETHPEYFAWRDGKRINNGQLCLTNPDVMKICTERLMQTMHDYPLYRIYSLSQNDNQRFCECEKCKAVEEKYGGHSGLIVWFVNQVADEVKKEFSEKYVGTFAYQYSRKPPVNIVPRDNVVIRLCSIECCFAHPLSDECPANKAFMNDLRAWSTIAPHLFIWDYIVDYAQYMAPWPNFQVLGPNIKTFAQNKAIGIFEEAQYQSNGGEFDEMKAWVVTKLLWNPEQNVSELVRDFVYGFYGPAAPKIMEYYQLCQSLVKEDTHYNIYIREQDKIYSDEFVKKGFRILNDARALATDQTTRDRVNRVRMQLLYLQCVRHKKESLADGTWDEFLTLARKLNARPSEGKTLEKFISEMEQTK